MIHHNYNNRAVRDGRRNPLEQVALFLIGKMPVPDKDEDFFRKRRHEEERRQEYLAKSKHFGYFQLESEAEQPRINAFVFGVDKTAVDYMKPQTALKS